MLGYIIVSIVSGILFGILDCVIHANPLAQRLYEGDWIVREELEGLLGRLAGRIRPSPWGDETITLYRQRAFLEFPAPGAETAR